MGRDNEKGKENILNYLPKIEQELLSNIVYNSIGNNKFSAISRNRS